MYENESFFKTKISFLNAFRTKIINHRKIHNYYKLYYILVSGSRGENLVIFFFFIPGNFVPVKNFSTIVFAVGKFCLVWCIDEVIFFYLFYSFLNSWENPRYKRPIHGHIFYANIMLNNNRFFFLEFNAISTNVFYINTYVKNTNSCCNFFFFSYN